MKNKNTGQLLAAINFMVLMAALGASDSLRGIFAPAFQTHFSLSPVSFSLIVVVSYLGNLIFLSLGGRIMDRCGRKKAAVMITFIWLAALALYIITDNFLCLLTGMFLAMGASTLLNTTVNILTPVIFTAAPGMMVNIFFFVQGIGTTVCQNLAGHGAGSYGAFRTVTAVLLGMGIVSVLMLLRIRIPEMPGENEKEKQEPVSYRAVFKRRGFWLLTVIFGLYFVSEHGIMNWMVSYGTQGLNLEVSEASNALSGFYGGMTIGRLLFAPVVNRIGAQKSILLFGGIGTVLFVIGIVTGQRGLWLLSLSGLAISILYPTLVYMIRFFYPEQMLATALGVVISTATLFDIGFNMGFGKLIEAVGYRTGYMVMPVSMVLFYLCCLAFMRRGTVREAAETK